MVSKLHDLLVFLSKQKAWRTAGWRASTSLQAIPPKVHLLWAEWGCPLGGLLTHQLCTGTWQFNLSELWIFHPVKERQAACLGVIIKTKHETKQASLRTLAWLSASLSLPSVSQGFQQPFSELSARYALPSFLLWPVRFSHWPLAGRQPTLGGTVRI